MYQEQLAELSAARQEEWKQEVIEMGLDPEIPLYMQMTDEEAAGLTYERVYRLSTYFHEHGVDYVYDDECRVFLAGVDRNNIFDAGELVAPCIRAVRHYLGY